MHKEILVENQIQILPLLKDFSNEFYLVGGTAIALQINHRRSIDFDLFSQIPLKKNSINNVIMKNFKIDRVLYEDSDEFTMMINAVKITFFHYPFNIYADLSFNNIIKIPSLLNLAAMKAYALGRRAKWKDYVDLYFIFKYHHSLKEVSDNSEQIFGNLFNEKLFREQLCYFEDVDYSEPVEFIGEKIEGKVIKTFLTEIATTNFD